jgi:hypothetical protein
MQLVAEYVNEKMGPTARVSVFALFGKETLYGGASTGTSTPQER